MEKKDNKSTYQQGVAILQDRQLQIKIYKCKFEHGELHYFENVVSHTSVPVDPERLRPTRHFDVTVQFLDFQTISSIPSGNMSSLQPPQTNS